MKMGNVPINGKGLRKGREMIDIENFTSAEEEQRAARSKLYQLLSDSLKYPGSEFLEMVKDGTFLEGLSAVAAGLPYALPMASEHLGGASLADVTQEDFEAEFIQIFDAGPGGPPFPLRESHYHGARMTIMEELVRFYNHFGVSTTQGTERELPDALTTELEFLHYLTFKEVIALQRGDDAAPYLRAEKDFLERHPAKWLPILTKALDELIAKDYERINKAVIQFYRDLLGLVENLARSDLVHVAAQCN